MTEKHQIEEMAKALRETKENAREVCHIQPSCRDLCKYSKVEYCLDTIQAEELYKQGYRKIDEGSVVIPNKITEETSADDLVKIAKYNDEIRKKARQETAKEILQIIKREYDYIGDLERIIAKQYGVEIDND